MNRQRTNNMKIEINLNITLTGLGQATLAVDGKPMSAGGLPKGRVGMAKPE